MSQAEPRDAAPERAPARWPVVVPLVAGLAFYAVFIARSAFRVGGTVYFTLFDDAMVSMRYARNLADGEGLVWNEGEQVEGYTNFLWTLWMSGLHLVGLGEAKISLVVMLSGAGLLVANLFLVRAMVARLAPRSDVTMFVALGLVALAYPVVFWTLRGMEVGLVTVVVCALVVQAVRVRERPTPGRLLALGAIAAVGLLTRDDLLIAALIALGFAAVWVRHERPVARVALILAPMAVAVVGHEAYRLAYYDELLPNTYDLKLGGASLLEHRVPRGAATIAHVIVVQLYAAVALAALWLFSAPRARPPMAWLMAAVVLGQAAYSVSVGGDAWEWMNYANRYLASALPLLFVLAAIGVVDLASAPAGVRRRRALYLAAGTVGIAVLTAAWPFGAIREVGQFGYESLEALARVAVALTLAAALAFVALRGARHSPLLLALGLGTALFATINGPPLAQWLRNGGLHVRNDAYMARYGLELRSRTPADASIAVVWAGAVPYFADRPAVDLLGKADEHVARGPVRGRFYPGHNKWDTAYSLGRLRPEVVAQTVTLEDRRYARALGYVTAPLGDAPAPPEGLPLNLRCCGLTLPSPASR